MYKIDRHGAPITARTLAGAATAAPTWSEALGCVIRQNDLKARMCEISFYGNGENQNASLELRDLVFPERTGCV